MKGSRIAKLAFLGMAVLGAVETAQAAAVYSFTTIHVTSAAGINSSSQIVGTSGNGGFLYSGGSFATIAVPGNTITVPYGINNSGQIVGSFFDSLGEHGFLYRDGMFTTIDYPGTGATMVQAINNSGEIVGGTGGPGFLYNNGSFSTIEIPGAVRTIPTGINDRGQIVGWFIDTTFRNSHGFLYDNGSFTTIDLPGSRFTEAHGINNNGQILVDFVGTDGAEHAVLDNAGTFTTINVPGAIDTFAEGINDGGEIVGYFRDSTGLHGFFATPGTNSRTFSFGDKGAAVFITGGSGNLAVGYGRVVPDGGQTAPSGVAIFGERSGSTVISEAGVPASPLIRNGRIYAEVSPNGFSGRGTDIGLSIANPGPTPATIGFTYTRSDGTDLGGGSYTLGAGLQKSSYLDQAPWNIPLNFQGTFTFTSTAPIAVVALQLYNNERGEPLMTTLPVIDTNAGANSAPALLSHFVDGLGWSTTVILVNQTETAQSGTIVFHDDVGNAVTLKANSTIAVSFAYSIPKHSSFKLQTEGGVNLQGGSAAVTPDAGSNTPVPLSVFSFYNGQAIQTQAGVPSNLGTAFRTYVEATANPRAIGGYDSGIAVANGSASQGTVTFELYTTTGAPTGLSTTIQLTAFGHKSEFIDEFFPGLTLPFQGVLRISTSLPEISVVALRIRYNERNEFLMTTTPPSNEMLEAGTAEVDFPQIVTGAGWTTQFNLFSGVTNQATSGTLTFVQPDGTPFDIETNKLH